MSGNFVKVYGSILRSSVWSESVETRLLWIALLAMSDANGFVEGAVPGIAHQANLPLEATRRGLEILQAPDPDSKDPDHEGRRIEKVAGGFLILNYDKYRERRTETQIQTAKRTRAWRERHKASQASHVTGVTVGDAQKETETETEDTKKKNVRTASATERSVDDLSASPADAGEDSTSSRSPGSQPSPSRTAPSGTSAAARAERRDRPSPSPPSKKGQTYCSLDDVTDEDYRDLVRHVWPKQTKRVMAYESKCAGAWEKVENSAIGEADEPGALVSVICQRILKRYSETQAKAIDHLASVTGWIAEAWDQTPGKIDAIVAAVLEKMKTKPDLVVEQPTKQRAPIDDDYAGEDADPWA